jgi:putative ABC transport system permease protein
MNDWRALVREEARQSGVDLPAATVEELALHLEDAERAARERGATAADAQARALDVLRQSSLAGLARHASRHAERTRARHAEVAVGAGGEGRGRHLFGAFGTAARQFRHHPGFSLVTVLVLGLGTAAATTVFTVVDSVVLRPLPYRAPASLVTLWDTNFEKGLGHDPVSPVNFLDYRALPVFESAAAWWRPSLNLIDRGLEPVRVNAVETSGNLFEVLGVGPQIGAGFPAGGPLFLPNEPSVVISDRLWRARYGGDAAVVGRQVNLDGTPHTVLGVMPARFHYPGDTDVWQRLQWDPALHSRGAHFMEAVARMAPATSLEKAQAAVDALASRLQGEFAATNHGWSVRLIPLLDDQLGYHRPALLVLFGAVGLLLVMGCLNVASLLLTRTLSRDREMAVRVALGASPRQLAAQLLAESMVLCLAGAALGIAAAAALLWLIVAFTPVAIPRLDDARLDLRALGFSLAILAATTTFFSLVPVLALLRRKIAVDLKSGERGSSRGARGAYSVIVASEVALACALLVGSTLLVRTVSRMTRTPLGVDADHVLTTALQLPTSAYPTWPSVMEAHAAIGERIRQQPGVEAAGAANFLPLQVGWRIPFTVLGEPAPARPEDAPQAQFHSVSDGFFESLGAELSLGRALSSRDTADAPGVVVVNERFARRYLEGRAAVGEVLLTTVGNVGPLGVNLRWLRQVRPRTAGAPPPPAVPPTRFEIVGVVRDVRNAPLGHDTEPAVYFSTRQFPFRELFLTVRAKDRATALAAVRTSLREVAPHVPVGPVQTWGERFAHGAAVPRLLMTILVVFGGLAALLAAVGVYGLFSWSVVLRRRELAIRLTLGAAPISVGRLLLQQSALLVLTGLAGGLLLIRLGERTLTGVLYEVSPTDPGSTAMAGGLLLLAALIACLPPAVRAMRVDPAVGLRAE